MLPNKALDNFREERESYFDDARITAFVGNIIATGDRRQLGDRQQISVGRN